MPAYSTDNGFTGSGAAWGGSSVTRPTTPSVNAAAAAAARTLAERLNSAISSAGEHNMSSGPNAAAAHAAQMAQDRARAEALSRSSLTQSTGDKTNFGGETSTINSVLEKLGLREPTTLSSALQAHSPAPATPNTAPAVATPRPAGMDPMALQTVMKIAGTSPQAMNGLGVNNLPSLGQSLMGAETLAGYGPGFGIPAVKDLSRVPSNQPLETRSISPALTGARSYDPLSSVQQSQSQAQPQRIAATPVSPDARTQGPVTNFSTPMATSNMTAKADMQPGLGGYFSDIPNAIRPVPIGEPPAGPWNSSVAYKNVQTPPGTSPAIQTNTGFPGFGGPGQTQTAQAPVSTQGPTNVFAMRDMLNRLTGSPIGPGATLVTGAARTGPEVGTQPPASIGAPQPTAGQPNPWTERYGVDAISKIQQNLQNWSRTPAPAPQQGASDPSVYGMNMPDIPAPVRGVVAKGTKIGDAVAGAVLPGLEKLNAVTGGSPYNDLYGRPKATPDAHGKDNTDSSGSPKLGRLDHKMLKGLSSEDRATYNALSRDERNSLSKYMKDGMTFAEALAKVKGTSGSGTAAGGPPPVWVQPTFAPTPTANMASAPPNVTAALTPIMQSIAARLFG